MEVFFLDKNLWQIDLVAQSKKTGSKIFEGGGRFQMENGCQFLAPDKLDRWGL